MPHQAFAKTGKVLAAAVLATGGMLAFPAAPAQAADCVWEFNGPFKFKQGDGIIVDLDTDQSKAVTGIALMFDGKTSWNGDPFGGIDGNAITVNVEWFGLEHRSYPGTIGPDGLVAGTVAGPTINTTYQSTSALRCIPKDAAAQRGITVNVTVNGDVDVYDVPDGVGTVIGMLAKGATVQLVEPCRDGWCHVQNGWVWGDFLDQ
jgi:hypothetical protein